MDKVGDRRPAVEENRSSEEDVRSQSMVAAVSCPAAATARLTLPGVMDSEGRVDESRLRLYIFKNGIYLFFNIIFVMICNIKLFI